MKSLFIFVLICSFNILAKAPLCSDLPFLRVGTICKLNPIFLTPTQHTLGLKAVDAKKDKLIEKYLEGRSSFDKYLWKKKKVPIVLGAEFENKEPTGKFAYYMTDAHHTMRALVELNLNYPIYIEVTHDFRRFTFNYFWRAMTQENLVYHRKLGEVQPVELLPKSLFRLIDDPYRTLSWQVREDGCYENLDNIAFQEFFWADFMRDKLGPDELEKARAFAISDLAAGLPGYTGKCQRQE